MLLLTIPGYEWFDEKTNQFGSTKTATLLLEHSLLSVSKWEARWEKPFLGREQKSIDECIDYIRCMTLTENVDPLVYKGLTDANFELVNAYMEAKMTATWFREEKGLKPNRDVITSEVIYYWMISLGIPFECEKWHLNRLLTLIRVCNAKNAPKKKNRGGRSAMLEQRAALNRARREKLHTRG